MTIPDLDDVDALCRLAVVARRLGCEVHLAGASAELRSLLELSGVHDVLGDCPLARRAAGQSPGRPAGPSAGPRPRHPRVPSWEPVG